MNPAAKSAMAPVPRAPAQRHLPVLSTGGWPWRRSGGRAPAQAAAAAGQDAGEVARFRWVPGHERAGIRGCGELTAAPGCP